MRVEIGGAQLAKRRTKIVATVGPSSSDEATLTSLVAAGVDVFRLNMSHGDHDTHRRAHALIREVTKKAGRAVAILIDLCGPKIRVGSFRDGFVDVETGSRVRITTRDVTGEPGLIPSGYAALASDVRPGDRILLDDGNLEFRVESVDGTEIECAVVAGGRLKDKKGMNLPGVSVSAPSLTEKDREDAHFGLGLGVEYFALSFVRRPEDVIALRDLCEAAGQRASIIAKIEKPEALDEIDGILDAADGIMVARGDLGVELPPEVVPVAQDQLVDLARQRCKPVIVATQMLESMITNPRPTRAEVSDVAHAVGSGADAVMLSAETAAGDHPLAAVKTMDAVARRSESYLWEKNAFGGLAGRTPRSTHAPVPLAEAIADATARLSRQLQVRSIVVVTRTGLTAAVMSASRPASPLLCATADPGTYSQLALLWGVVPQLVATDELDDLHTLARHLAQTTGLAQEGQFVLCVRGFRSNGERDTPEIHVVSV